MTSDGSFHAYWRIVSLHFRAYIILISVHVRYKSKKVQKVKIKVKKVKKSKDKKSQNKSRKVKKKVTSTDCAEPIFGVHKAMAKTSSAGILSTMSHGVYEKENLIATAQTSANKCQTGFPPR